jgi:hypothetical protein
MVIGRSRLSSHSASTLAKLLVQACEALCFAKSGPVQRPHMTPIRPPAANNEDQVFRLVKTDGLAHGGLDVERLDVLPVLLEERDQEVDGQHDVTKNLVIVHLNVADSDTQAENLLELELDGGANLSELVAEVFAVRDGGGEFASLRETGTKETRNLLDEGLRSQEGIVLLSELLDELLVLVELLQVIDGHVLQLNLLSTIDIVGISENADGHAGTRDIRELDGSRETLVPLRIVVLETNLEFDGLNELPLLLTVGVSQQLFDGASHT